MTKISDHSSLTGAGVDGAADVLPIVDMSEAGAVRNKKITVDELIGLAGGGTTFASDAEVRAGTEAAKALSPDNVFDAAAVVVLTPGANVSLDMATGFNFSLAMGGNYTLDNPTNPKVGQSGFITITQDGTGSRTLAYGTNWEFEGGAAPVLTTTASAKDVLFYQVLGATSIFASLVKAVA